MSKTNRWGIAIAGACLQLCLGTVYAWSYFQKPLMEAGGWNNTQVAWVFSLAICFLGLAAAVGGVALPRVGPRLLAIAGGMLFSLAHGLAAVALHFKSLPLLFVGYGVIGGIGLGFGYVTPVATTAKWFPDKKGLATGMVIMGFGFGALLMSKILAPFLMKQTNNNLVHVFAVLGLVFLVLTPLTGLFLVNPPSERGSVHNPSVSALAATGKELVNEVNATVGCLVSRRFLILWGLFFCNITAGIMIISFQSPLLQDLLKAGSPALSASDLAAYGATLIAVSSLFNGLGRLAWGALSDRTGRLAAFRFMLLSQTFIFALLAVTSHPWLFCVQICYILFCYGGGFGTMPSFVLDVFGGRMMPTVYGTILTAWSAAGIIGPQIVARLKDQSPERAATYAFLIGAAFLAAGLGLTFFNTAISHCTDRR